jgi:hypothetical protein
VARNYVDAREFSRLQRELKDFDRKLATAVRRELRDAAKDVASHVAREVRDTPPPNDNPRVTAGTRDRIAAGVGVRISTGAGKKGGDVAIVASSKALPAERKRMVQLYNRDRPWRHPVFGNRDVWQVQRGAPYFDKTILERAGDLRAAVERAMKRAADALARRA